MGEEKAKTAKKSSEPKKKKMPKYPNTPTSDQKDSDYLLLDFRRGQIDWPEGTNVCIFALFYLGTLQSTTYTTHTHMNMQTQPLNPSASKSASHATSIVKHKCVHTAIGPSDRNCVTRKDCERS